MLTAGEQKKEIVVVIVVVVFVVLAAPAAAVVVAAVVAAAAAAAANAAAAARGLLLTALGRSAALKAAPRANHNSSSLALDLGPTQTRTFNTNSGMGVRSGNPQGPARMPPSPSADLV